MPRAPKKPVSKGKGKGSRPGTYKIPGGFKHRAELEELTTKVATLRVKGLTFKAIARELAKEGIKIHSTNVFRAWERAKAEWRAKRDADVDDWIDEELQRLSVIETEAWEQWDRSKKDAVKRVSETGGAPTVDDEEEPKAGKVTTTVEGQCADAAYQSIILNCIEKRAKLRGIYKPGKLEHTGKDGEPLVGLAVVRQLQEADER